jgi:hypothetical protein
VLFDGVDTAGNNDLWVTNGTAAGKVAVQKPTVLSSPRLFLVQRMSLFLAPTHMPGRSDNVR